MLRVGVVVAALATAAGLPARALAAAPIVGADAPSVTAEEGTVAEMTGSYSDPDGDPVALGASAGWIESFPPGSTTRWRWTGPAADGPALETITITADDGQGPPSETQFDIAVINRPPSAVTEGPDYVAVESAAPHRFLWAANDVVGDTVTTTFWCGPNPPIATGFTYTVGRYWADCLFASAGPVMVGVVASDEDGGLSDSRIEVTATPSVKSMADGLIRITGAGDSGHLGWALVATDVSGDGKADLVIGGGTRDSLPVLPGPGFVQVLFNRSVALATDTDSIPAGSGFKILAADADDQLGRDIAAAGDINGDGIGDLIISARDASPFGRTNAGAAYVVFGSASTSDVDLANLPLSRGFRIAGAGSFRGASAVTGVGDVNDDGFDDVAVGSPYAEPLGRTGAGIINVIFGRASPTNLDLASLPTGSGFEIDGQAFDGAGGSIADGDINGDGWSDIILGVRSSAGKVWAVYGSAAPTAVDLASVDPARGFSIGGFGSNSSFGSSVASGDIDGDGFDDIVAGSPGWNPGNNVEYNVGAVYVVRGATSNSSIANVLQGDGLRTFRIRGEARGQEVGSSVATGDWSGDGRADILIGGPMAEPNWDASGSAWIVNGGSQLVNVDLGVLADGWGRVDGTIESNAGVGVAIGDLTGDGIGDLAVGAPGYQSLGNGLVSVFAGSPPVDSTPPVGSVSLAAGAPTTTTSTVSASVPATDNQSAVTQVALSNDGTTWMVRTYGPTQPWTLAPGEGIRTVFVKWSDAAGNWSAAASDSIVVDLPGLVTRQAGPNRYATAAAISAGAFSPGVPVAYVALGTNFPDALAAAAAAGHLGGPLLLVTTSSIPAETAAELARLKPGRIVVAGGISVVSDAVLGALDPYTTGTVTRQAGPNRYATAAAISAGAFSPGVPVAYVALGTNFPDALAAAAAAGHLGGPLLLVTTSSIPAETAAELARLKPGRIVVAGGISVVSDAVLGALAAY